MSTPALTFRARRLITRELGDLAVRLGGLSPSDDAGARRTGDEADRIQAREEHDLGVAERARLVARHRALTAALHRLDDDSYGLCLECGEPIAETRLLVIPEVERCVRCQEQAERAGQGLARRRIRWPEVDDE